MTRTTLLDVFTDLAATRGEFLVYDDGFRSVSRSYGDVARAARALAARLAAHGVAQGDRIIIWGENRPEWVVALWAAIIAGVVVVFVSVLSMATGFRAAMEGSGSPSRAIVMRSGADSEMTRGLSGTEVDVIKQAPGLRRDGHGVGIDEVKANVLPAGFRVLETIDPWSGSLFLVLFEATQGLLDGVAHQRHAAQVEQHAAFGSQGVGEARVEFEGAVEVLGGLLLIPGTLFLGGEAEEGLLDCAAREGNGDRRGIAWLMLLRQG